MSDILMARRNCPQYLFKNDLKPCRKFSNYMLAAFIYVYLCTMLRNTLYARTYYLIFIARFYGQKVA